MSFSATSPFIGMEKGFFAAQMQSRCAAELHNVIRLLLCCGRFPVVIVKRLGILEWNYPTHRCCGMADLNSLCQVRGCCDDINLIGPLPMQRHTATTSSITAAAADCSWQEEDFAVSSHTVAVVNRSISTLKLNWVGLQSSESFPPREAAVDGSIN